MRTASLYYCLGRACPDCLCYLDDELLLQQAERVLARDPGIEGEQPRVWLYRNRIKALNWIGQVREKLDDPMYADWFVPFNSSYHGRSSNNSFHVPACDWYGDAKSGPPKCSKFYHDQGTCIGCRLRFLLRYVVWLQCL